MAVATTASVATPADAFVGKTVRACGFGSTANYPTYAAKLRCTDLNVVAAATCGTVGNTICTVWDDRENNVW